MTSSADAREGLEPVRPVDPLPGLLRGRRVERAVVRGPDHRQGARPSQYHPRVCRKPRSSTERPSRGPATIAESTLALVDAQGTAPHHTGRSVGILQGPERAVKAASMRTPRRRRLGGLGPDRDPMLSPIIPRLVEHDVEFNYNDQEGRLPSPLWPWLMSSVTGSDGHCALIALQLAFGTAYRPSCPAHGARNPGSDAPGRTGPTGNSEAT